MENRTVEIDFCYGHRLLNYAGKCKHLHGHSARVAITLDGAVDTEEAAQQAQQWVDAHLTRRMVLCERDPALPGLEELGEPVYLMADNPTTENLSALLYREFRKLGLPVASVRVWESPRCSATYYEPAGENAS